VPIIKDMNGNHVPVSHNEIIKVMTKEGFKIFGVDVNCIRTFIKIYKENRGPEIITEESIRETLTRIPF